MGATFATLHVADGSGPLRAIPTALRSPAELAALAEEGVAALYLEVADSDTWGFAVLGHGAVLAHADGLTAPGLPPALATQVADAARLAFGRELDPAALSAPASADGPFAEAAMGVFARHFGIASAAPTAEARPAAPLPPAPAYDIHLHASVEGTLPRPPAEHLAELAGILGGERDERPADAGGGRLAIDLAGASITCEPDPVELHVLAPAALDAGGAPVDPATVALLLGAAPALHAALFEATGALHGYATTVPANDPEEAVAIRAWPPPAHWLDHLSPALVERCGGGARVTQALAGLTVEPGADGALTSRLPVDPERAADPELAPLKARLATLIAEAGA